MKLINGSAFTQGLLAAALPLALSLGSVSAQAGTVVEFNTNMGVFTVDLYDGVTPATVQNFLNYVADNRYDSTIFHRSVPNFVIQGGGFSSGLSEVPTFAPIVNESQVSNLRGTIAMARTPALDSATSQWFINTKDNMFLDTAKYAVFGKVIGNGMTVVDAIAAVPTYAFSSPFGELPLLNYTAANHAAGILPSAPNFVTLSISVVPEPASIALMLLGLVGVGAAVRAGKRRG